jgi:hypothetical protein
LKILELEFYLPKFENMKAVIIKPKSATELKFINDLLKKLGVDSSTVSKEEIEDIGLSKAMRGVDKNKKVSKVSIVNKLKS